MSDLIKPITLEEEMRNRLNAHALEIAKQSQLSDPDYCGLGKANTGPLDPWWKRACIPHDKAMQAYIDGHPTEGPYQTFGKFTKNIGVGMLQGAYMLLTGIPYWLIGGFGGLFRNQQLANRLKPHEEDDDVLGDDT